MDFCTSSSGMSRGRKCWSMTPQGSNLKRKHLSLTSFHAFSLEWSQVKSRPSIFFVKSNYSVIALCESFWSSRRDCVPSTHQTSPVYSTRSSDVVGILMVAVKTGFRYLIRFQDLHPPFYSAEHGPFPRSWLNKGIGAKQATSKTRAVVRLICVGFSG